MQTIQYNQTITHLTQSTMLKTPIQAQYNQEIYQEQITICQTNYAAAEHSEKHKRGTLISS